MPAGTTERLVAALGHVTEMLAADVSTDAALRRFAERCPVWLPSVTAVATILCEPDGEVRPAGASAAVLLAANREWTRSGSSPDLVCVRTGRRVTVRNLGPTDPQWPAFARTASRYGFRAATSLPMRETPGSQVVGAVTLLASAPEGPEPGDLAVAQSLTDAVAASIGVKRAMDLQRDLAAQLRHALDSRVLIEQAKGLVAGYRRVSIDVAFKMLRAYARANHRRLADLAEAIVADHSRTAVLPLVSSAEQPAAPPTTG